MLLGFSLSRNWFGACARSRPTVAPIKISRKTSFSTVAPIKISRKKSPNDNDVYPFVAPIKISRRNLSSNVHYLPEKKSVIAVPKKKSPNDVYRFNLLLKQLSRTGNWRESLKLLDAVTSASSTFSGHYDLISFNTVLCCLQRCGEAKASLSLLKEMIVANSINFETPGTNSINLEAIPTPISYWRQVEGNRKKLENVISEIECKRKIERRNNEIERRNNMIPAPDMYSFVTVINTCAKRGEFAPIGLHLLEEVIPQLWSKNWESNNSLNPALRNHANSSTWLLNAGLRCCEKMKVHPNLTASSMRSPSVTVEHGDWRRAIGLVVQYFGKVTELDLVTWLLLIRVCEKSRSGEALSCVAQLLEKMQTRVAGEWRETIQFIQNGKTDRNSQNYSSIFGQWSDCCPNGHLEAVSTIESEVKTGTEGICFFPPSDPLGSSFLYYLGRVRMLPSTEFQQSFSKMIRKLEHEASSSSSKMVRKLEHELVPVQSPSSSSPIQSLLCCNDHKKIVETLGTFLWALQHMRKRFVGGSGSEESEEYSKEYKQFTKFYFRNTFGIIRVFNQIMGPNLVLGLDEDSTAKEESETSVAPFICVFNACREILKGEKGKNKGFNLRYQSEIKDTKKAIRICLDKLEPFTRKIVNLLGEDTKNYPDSTEDGMGGFGGFRLGVDNFFRHPETQGVTSLGKYFTRYFLREELKWNCKILNQGEIPPTDSPLKSTEACSPLKSIGSPLILKSTEACSTLKSTGSPLKSTGSPFPPNDSPSPKIFLPPHSDSIFVRLEYDLNLMQSSCNTNTVTTLHEPGVFVKRLQNRNKKNFKRGGGDGSVFWDGDPRFQHAEIVAKQMILDRIGKAIKKEKINLTTGFSTKDGVGTTQFSTKEGIGTNQFSTNLDGVVAVTGVIRFCVSHTPCLSCIVKGFLDLKKQLPQVKIEVSYQDAYEDCLSGRL